MAACGSIPNSTILRNTCNIACTWASPPGQPSAMMGLPFFQHQRRVRGQSGPFPWIQTTGMIRQPASSGSRGPKRGSRSRAQPASCPDRPKGWPKRCYRLHRRRKGSWCRCAIPLCWVGHSGACGSVALYWLRRQALTLPAGGIPIPLHFPGSMAPSRAAA